MIAFGDVTIDVKAHELRRSGTIVNVEPQVFAVLVHLIEHRDRLVPKAELLDAVWGHRFVTESALTSRIKTARQAIGDTGRDQRMIKTVHGKGYRFVADVSEPSAGRAERPRPEPPVSPAELLDALASGRGAAVDVDQHAAGLAWLRELREHAVTHQVPVGHGSARRTSLRTYGCLLDAIDEVVGRHPEALDALAPDCRHEIAAVLAGSIPSRRQRWVLAVHELVVCCARQLGGLVLVLDGIEHADEDTISVIGHLGDLTQHHAFVLAVGATSHPGLHAFRHVPLPDTPAPAAAHAPELPADVAEAVSLVELLEPPFDLDTLAAALAAPAELCARLLAVCDRLGAITAIAGRYSVDVDRLLVDPRPRWRGADHRLIAERLASAGADPARIAHHYIEAGDLRRAVPYATTTARSRLAAGLYRETLRWVDRVLSEADSASLGALHALRADALGALGDPAAVAAYRQAITYADRAQLPRLRARLARAALWSGDLELADDVLRGLEPDGGDGDDDLLLVRGMLAYFRGDLDAADDAADAARTLALSPGASTSLLDAITLQGMIAHSRGQWSDRLLRELRDHRNLPDVATTVFDCHLCVAEYLLYGPTPYADVIELAQRLQAHAEELDAQRAVAFASCVAGEAALLSGDLDTADDLLTRSVQLHRELGGDTGLAHSLQRLAEVRLAVGERAQAEQLARDALVRARWSPLSHHLLQRIYGTLVRAAADAGAALAAVDEAAQVRDEADNCHFCEVMFAVPAAIACAQGGRPDDAARYLDAAARSALLWQGTAWQGAVAEARASLASATGDAATADTLLRSAAVEFERAGQPLDAARCRDALSTEA